MSLPIAYTTGDTVISGYHPLEWVRSFEAAETPIPEAVTRVSPNASMGPRF